MKIPMDMEYLVYDIEIAKAIPDRGKPPEPGIDYCAGWHDHKNMGISVIGAYDSREERYRVFCRDNFRDFLELVKSHRMFVSFNGINFDNRVIDAVLDEYILPERCYDILQEMWAGDKLGPTFNPSTHGGYGLDATCRANFRDLHKTGKGDLAPIAWQRGCVGQVIDYCLNDVRMTHMLLRRIINDRGWIINPKRGGSLRVTSVYDRWIEIRRALGEAEPPPELRGELPLTAEAERPIVEPP